MLFAPEQSFRNLTCLLLEGGARNDAEYAFFSKLHYAKLKNAEGLEYFEYYTNARKQALKEYSSRFSPLTLDTVPKGTDFWAWANEPWPWEMEG